MSDAINRLIAETLGIEHVFMQEGEYKEQGADFGHAKWITILDGDEIWGEAFPKDWEHDLNAAWDRFWELPDAAIHAYPDEQPGIICVDWDDGHPQIIPSKDGSTKAVARAICEAWLKWKGVDIERK